MVLSKEIQIVLGGRLIAALFYFLGQEPCQVHVDVDSQLQVLGNMFINFKEYVTPGQIFLFFILVSFSSSSVSFPLQPQFPDGNVLLEDPNPFAQISDSRLKELELRKAWSPC